MTIASKHNVPSLRFSDFSGEWDSLKLGDVATFGKGKGISKADIEVDGSLECIRYGQLYTDYLETIRDIKSRTNVPESELVLSDVNDIIIPASGETQIDIATASCVLKKGIALGGDLNIVKTKHDGVFLSYYLNSKRKYDIARLSQGISVVHLYAAQLKLLHLNLPDLTEQQKITSFLTSVDTKVEQLSKKKTLLEKYKKGMMQKLFSQAYRFKDAHGISYPDWRRKRLGELGKFRGGGTPDTKKKEYWNGAIPWISSSDIFDDSVQRISLTRRISETAIKNSATKIIPPNSLLIVSRVGVGKLAVSVETLCTSQDFCNFTPKEDHVLFLAYWMSENKHKLLSLCQGTSIKGLTTKELRALEINLPCVKEQLAIADFLSVLDKKINLTSAELNQAQAFKKGLLQQMFI